MRNLEIKLKNSGLITKNGKLNKHFKKELFNDFYNGEKINLENYSKTEINLFFKALKNIHKVEVDPSLFNISRKKQILQKNKISQMIISYFEINTLKQLIKDGRL